jgi:hypothetical protein
MLAIILPSCLQSSALSCTIQRESTHKNRRPSWCVKWIASRKVFGRLSHGMPDWKSTSVAVVVLRSDRGLSPQQWLKQAYGSSSPFEMCKATCSGPSMRNTLVGSLEGRSVGHVVGCCDKHVASHARAVDTASSEPVYPEIGLFTGKECGHRFSAAQEVSRSENG